MYPVTRGIQQLPTNPARLAVLRAITSNLFEQRGRLNILEIGSLFGDSAKVLAQYGNVICVDLWDFEGGFQTFIKNVEGLPVTPMVGASNVILPSFVNKSFDLIYIDGDHTYPNVDEDILISKRLINKGGIICGDDLELLITTEEQYKEALSYRTQDYINGYHPGISCAVYSNFGQVSALHGLWWVNE